MANDVETCRKNKWTVGTVLVGTEGKFTDMIQITAIGESNVLAKWFDEGVWGRERLTSLQHRDWRLLKNQAEYFARVEGVAS